MIIKKVIIVLLYKLKQTIMLSIELIKNKDKRSKGKYYHKMPYGISNKDARKIASIDITSECKKNYLHDECEILASTGISFILPEPQIYNTREQVFRSEFVSQINKKYNLNINTHQIQDISTEVLRSCFVFGEHINVFIRKNNRH